jgi:hypothetical protein
MIDRIFVLKMWHRGKRTSVRGALLLLAAVVIFATAAQTACSKKVKVGVENSGPVRVVVLPFKVSSEKAGENKELQWAAMAAPALLVRASLRLPDIEVVPFWEVMPAAISVAGAARSFSDDDAASIANWISAQWAVVGEIRRTESSSSYTMVMDFIPTNSATVPFRYIKTRRMENFGTNFYLGLRQWLRYITLRKIPLLQVREPGLLEMRPIGEALDKEYGWLATAEPGGAQAFVNELSFNYEDLAKLMFSPTMYPSLQSKPGTGSADRN